MAGDCGSLALIVLSMSCRENILIGLCQPNIYNAWGSKEWLLLRYSHWLTASRLVRTQWYSSRNSSKGNRYSTLRRYGTQAARPLQLSMQKMARGTAKRVLCWICMHQKPLCLHLAAVGATVLPNKPCNSCKEAKATDGHLEQYPVAAHPLGASGSFNAKTL